MAYLSELEFERKLENLTYPYYLQRGLKYEYVEMREEHLDSVERYEELSREKIQKYWEHDSVEGSVIHWGGRNPKPSTPEDIATPITHESDLPQIAKKAASYFRQANELYLTSKTMNHNTSPLIEYYSFLQFLKGSVWLKYEINEKLMFAYHGLACTYNSPEEAYPRAHVKTRGVFHTILFIYYIGKMDIFFNPDIDLSLDKSLENHRFDSIYGFIVSFLLSNLVRYYPLEWQKILLAEEDDIIKEINFFRSQELRKGMANLFPQFMD